MKTLLKDTIREIRNSFARFMSIFLIIALGVGFFAGIKATAPDMKHTGDVHFDNYNLMDFWVLSTLGFTDEDLEAFENMAGIEKVSEGYSRDLILDIGDEKAVAKAMSLADGYKNALNRPILVEGRMPNSKGECVLEASPSNMKHFKIGDRVNLSSGTEDSLKDDLENDQFTLVGFVNSPLHITYERGTSTIGNGKLDTFLLLVEDEFKYDYYTDIYLGIGQELDSFSDEYKDRLDQLKLDIEDLGESRTSLRLEEIKEEVAKELKKGQDRLEEEREKGQEELDQALRELESSKDKLDKGEASLKDARSKLYTGLREGEARLRKEEGSLSSGQEEYRKAKAKFDRERPALEGQIAEGEKKLKEGQGALSLMEANLGDLKAQLEGLEDEEAIGFINGEIEALEKEKLALEGEFKKGQEEVSRGRELLKQGERELREALGKLEIGRQELEKGRQSLKSERSKGETRLKEEEAKLRDGRKKLEEGQLKYEEGLEEFRLEINKGERELRRLENELDKLEKPDWYVIKRTDTRDYIEYEMGADRIDSVAKVFPLFFLLIALLVCLTTMTRMVDEQRGYIGTLKALGYSNRAIMTKYLLYGFIASSLGSILGLLIGFRVFPTVIFNAYRLMFIMPEIIIRFNGYFALISSLAAILTTFLAVFLALRKELREKPAMLMRPRAPKAGKRILLERIEPIWSRLKFSQKVTARNIFRYKRRLFMTIIGIAGCTALLLAGFGLKDSIMDITVNQFDIISDYEMSIDIADGIVDRKRDPIIDFLSRDDRVESFMLGYEKPIEAFKGDLVKELDMIVVEDDSNLDDYIRLRDRLGGEPIELDKDSVVLTEKMGEMLGVKAGDRLGLRIDDEDYELEVKGLTENYAFHYVYMKESLYKELLGEEVEFNKILAKNVATDDEFEDSLSEDILEVEDVSSVLFITGLSKSLNDTMDSLNSVVIVIIVAAGALAFIVLYNLTNINVSERMREIATIKVLGFHDREVSRYVYRENNILTILGTILGIFMGLVLHQFIILTVEIEMIMFGRVVRPISLVYAAVLTVVFSLMVNGVMHFRLKSIDMVESLKSVD